MFKRYLWKLCWLAFALVKRGESMKKTYLVVIVLFFISTKVYTLLHNNIFFCRNSPECDLSHVLPDYREQISGTPLKYTLINAPLAEPLTIALHALHRANVKAGEYVAIIGAGAIGLMAALSARHYKATPILIDIVEERLRYAQKLGVPYVLNAADDQVIDAIKNITHGTMAQVVIEASGANSAIRNTLDLASFAGRISFTGWPKQETSLPTNLITYKELDLRGSRTSAGEFDEALRMLSTLEINPQDVVSKVVNLDEIPDAVKELDRYPERYLKINAVFH